MNQAIKNATYKLIEALLEEYMKNGDQKHMDAVKKIMDAIKALQ